MTKADLHLLKNGLYLVDWKSGGHSLAAIGRYPDGNVWFAPTNWSNGSWPLLEARNQIRSLKLLFARPEDTVKYLIPYSNLMGDPNTQITTEQYFDSLSLARLLKYKDQVEKLIKHNSNDGGMPWMLASNKSALASINKSIAKLNDQLKVATQNGDIKNS